jgi:DNA mismatch repair ATPase MutS
MLPPATRVDNDVAVGPPGTVLLVTGSNMSGKSTLLRAIGLNTVLALAGGPVCARALRMPVVDLRTSIHIEDSLVRGVSFFMAQLQRMKEIVSAADASSSSNGIRVLYLLDEILQGTNTAERRIAATRVIRHLIDRGAIGAVTTHDLEIATDPALIAAADPVHFTETVEGAGGGATMSFDYLLRPGVATSTNALKLMEIVGLGT